MTPRMKDMNPPGEPAGRRPPTAALSLALLCGVSQVWCAAACLWPLEPSHNLEKSREIASSARMPRTQSAPLKFFMVLVVALNTTRAFVVHSPPSSSSCSFNSQR